MSRSPLLLLTACLIPIQFAGCSSTIKSSRTSNGKLAHSATSKSEEQRTDDRDAEDDEETDDRQKYLDDEIIAGPATEDAPDPWFGKYDYADQGRAIGRNL